MARMRILVACAGLACLREPTFHGVPDAAPGTGGAPGRDGAAGASGGGAGVPTEPFPPAGATLALREPVLADLDGDGLPEIVVPSAGEGAGRGVFVLPGGGGRRATRALPRIDAPADVGPPLSVAVADLDGDGVKDLVVLAGDGIRAHVLAYRGISASRFEPAIEKSVSTWFPSVSVPGPAQPAALIAVLDLDGRPGAEIAIGGPSWALLFTFPGFVNPAFDDAVRVLVPGQRTAGAWQGISRLARIGPAGQDRLLVVDRWVVSVFEPGDLGALEQRRHDTETQSSLSLGSPHLIDLDGDGSLDVLAISPGSSALFTILPWPVSTVLRWTDGCFRGCNYLPATVTAADLDGAAGARPEVLLLDAPPAPQAPLVLSIENLYSTMGLTQSNTPLVTYALTDGLRPSWLLSGDFDGDGRPEVLALDTTGRSACLRQSPGRLEACE